MTPTHFDTDPYPDQLRLLFIANAVSSHTHNWINLFADESLNTRLFALPHSAPPDDWPVPTYITGFATSYHVPESATRKRRYPQHPTIPSLSSRVIRRIKRQIGITEIKPDLSPEKWLIEVLDDWKPHIVHTLGMTSAQYLFDVLQKYAYTLQSQWFLSIWGAGDTTLQRAHTEKRRLLEQTLQRANWIIGDVEYLLNEARQLGVKEDQIPPHPLLPVAGGVNVDEIRSSWSDRPPSKRRMIIWPKAYNAYHASGLASLEALKLCWDQIQPCELVIPNLKGDLEMWYHTLPESFKAQTRIGDGLRHSEILDLMSKARIMLAPSLLDGLPNVLVEAMAAGAFPVMSPLPMYGDILVDGENALLARNLYPEEIAHAIIRAMNDDELVDRAAEHNVSLIRQIAHRPDVRNKALMNYRAAIQPGRTTT